MELSDKILQAAASKVSEAILTTLPNPEQCKHTFSLRFKIKMNILLFQHRKRQLDLTMKKVAAVAVFAILVIASLQGIDKNAYASFRTWLRIQYENSYIYQYFGPDLNANLPKYIPSWLPEDYVEVNCFVSDLMSTIIYSGPNGDIVFTYEWMSDDIMTEMFPEHSISHHVTVNGLSADFYFSTDDLTDDKLLIWFDEKTNLAFSISAFLDKSTRLRIAESVSLV